MENDITWSAGGTDVKCTKMQSENVNLKRSLGNRSSKVLSRSVDEHDFWFLHFSITKHEVCKCHCSHFSSVYVGRDFPHLHTSRFLTHIYQFFYKLYEYQEVTQSSSYFCVSILVMYALEGTGRKELFNKESSAGKNAVGHFKQFCTWKLYLSRVKKN